MFNTLGDDLCKTLVIVEHFVSKYIDALTEVLKRAFFDLVVGFMRFSVIETVPTRLKYSFASDE